MIERFEGRNKKKRILWVKHTENKSHTSQEVEKERKDVVRAGR